LDQRRVPAQVIQADVARALPRRRSEARCWPQERSCEGDLAAHPRPASVQIDQKTERVPSRAQSAKEQVLDRLSAGGSSRCGQSGARTAGQRDIPGAGGSACMATGYGAASCVVHLGPTGSRRLGRWCFVATATAAAGLYSPWPRRKSPPSGSARRPRARCGVRCRPGWRHWTWEPAPPGTSGAGCFSPTRCQDWP
jgi:hypothetical protein